MVFEVTESELAQSDRYEPAGYTRIAARLASGREAWVYADTRFAKGSPSPPFSLFPMVQPGNGCNLTVTPSSK